MRAAWRAGLVPVAAAERSLSARAPLALWRRWLGVEIPGSGPYLVEGAIKPVIIEVERDEGRYREPHLWVGSVGGEGSADDGWVAALRSAGVVAGERAHREVRRDRRLPHLGSALVRSMAVSPGAGGGSERPT